MNCYFSIRIIWLYLYKLLLWEWSWCPHVRILFLSTPLSLNMWTYFSISAFAWGQARSKLGGVDTSILHHAYMLIFIALWAVITRYVTILMPFLSYFTRFTWRGRMPAAGILGWKRSKLWKPILHNSKSPETPQNSVSENIKNIWRKKFTRGATGCPRGWGARPPSQGAPPASWASRKAPDAHLLLYEVFWPGKKIIRRLSGPDAAVSRRKPI